MQVARQYPPAWAVTALEKLVYGYFCWETGADVDSSVRGVGLMIIACLRH